MSGELVIIGDVITLDPVRPRVTAVAIVNGRIAATGSPADARAAVPAGTPEVTVSGTIIPGFVDSHVHLLWAGRRASRVSLTGATSIAEVQQRIRAHALANPGDGWIEADDDLDPWDLAENRLPTAAELETAAPGRGVLLDRRGHDALVNTTALHRAGITSATPDPPGGRIDRDPNGEPTGLLVEHPAVALARAVIPPPSGADHHRWIENGQRELLAHGITTAMDPAVSTAELSAYADAARAGTLQLRVTAMPLGSETTTFADLDRAAETCGLETADPHLLVRGPTKLFLDGGGSLGTALLSTPWPTHPTPPASPEPTPAAGPSPAEPAPLPTSTLTPSSATPSSGVVEPLGVGPSQPSAAEPGPVDPAYSEPVSCGVVEHSDYHGNQTLSREVVLAHCREAALAGRGAGVHAVGDAAIDLVLDVLGEVDAVTPVAGLGFHLIHAYLGPSPDAMRRARDLGVRVSAHPALQWDFGLGLIDRLGEDRAAAANPLRSWLDAGVEVGGGSDGPGPPMAPLHGMWQARTRHVRGRETPLGPEQAITAPEALELFTTGAARITGGPGTGRLRPGDPADLAFLTGDPLTPDPDTLRSLTVTATMVNGRLVFERPDFQQTTTTQPTTQPADPEPADPERAGPERVDRAAVDPAAADSMLVDVGSVVPEQVASQGAATGMSGAGTVAGGWVSPGRRVWGWAVSGRAVLGTVGDVAGG
ncbi:amidohydrolase [Actinoplanes derwentensis]|uniref:Amidohydrolase family protein n=1 Tax=Actinoplanes derwentensis TaxID=113562 RepID=A0A1H1ZHJ8_9ACTN|nr:amidohydrolase [Actinoplanes derwentensis]GID82447.1 hypothetical protein Ade03nite_13710 [Actinoplanes derwentensis]SDT33198.1 Amidohydrolase family protein [Actinoplanes derwentensis]